MSNLISALDKATDNSGIAKIEEIGLQGMITLRGDLSKAAVKKAATSVAPGIGTGIPVHAVTRRAILILIILIKNY